MIGVGQVALDREGRAIVADALGARELNVQPGAKPVLRAEVADGLASACAELAAKPSRSRQLVRIDERDGKALLLRPAPRTGEQAPKVAAATALVRRDVRENEASAARVAAACYGLSEREAALAVALSRGESLIEAGDKLRLTRETARNYSKRIYAKTGATGQADLVRMLLTGLVPFA